MSKYIIDSFRGGLSGESDKGIAGSFKFGRGLDIHKKEDTLSCNQAMKKESGAIVVDLILFYVPASDGNTYAFGDTGKIYKRTSAGVWSLVRSVGAKITGAEEWNGYIYYTHGVNLGRKPFPGLSDWSDAVDTWKTDLENCEWHTMKQATGNLLICNAEYLAMVAYYGDEGKASEGTSTTLKDDNKAWGVNDWQNQKVRITAGTGKGQERTISSNTSDTLTIPAWDTVPDTTSEYVITSVDVGIYNNTALELRPGNKSKCLLDRDDYTVIGSEMTDESEKGYLWTWATDALKWIKKKLIPAKGVNCLIDTEVMICQAGDEGEIFFSDLVNKKPINAFHGGGQVKPGGVCNKNGLAMFATYGNDECGIYSYGRRKMERPYVLNLDYIPSCGQSSSKVLGATEMVGGELLLSWKDGDDEMDSYDNTLGYLAIRNGHLTQMGQTFTALEGVLDKCKFYLKKGGSPTGNAVAKLYAHTGTFGVDGKPTGAVLATSGNLDVSTLTTSAVLKTFTFTGAEKINLTDGTHYCIVVEYTGGDSSNYIQIGNDGSSPTHSGNLCYYSSSSVWAASSSQDVAFFIYRDISYGSDVIDTANKEDGLFESLEFKTKDASLDKLFDILKITMRPLPTGCSIKVKTKVDNGSWVECKDVSGNVSFATVNATKALFNLGCVGEVFELQVELIVNGNTCPEINSLTSDFEPQEDL